MRIQLPLILGLCLSILVLPNATVLGSVKDTSDDLLIVDCLLPGQIRKLGRQMTYLTPRRPIKTTAKDCEIRGGEYVAFHPCLRPAFLFFDNGTFLKRRWFSF